MAMQNAQPLDRQLETFPAHFFTNSLTESMGLDKAVQFSQILQHHGAVAAGGGVLRSYAPFDLKHEQDIDVYVNFSRGNELYTVLYELGYKTNVSFYAPAYDQSFFRKNNILRRTSFYKQGTPPIDVMVVSDEVNVLTVVNNFDLDICEIWFDGVNVYTYNAEAIKTRVATLKPDYVLHYLVNHNSFTIKRMNKYISRGFNLKYVIPQGGVIDVQDTKNKTISSPEEWVVMTIMNYYSTTFQNPDKFDFFFTYPIKELKFENLLNILQRFVASEVFRSSPNLMQDIEHDLEQLYVNNISDDVEKLIFHVVNNTVNNSQSMKTIKWVDYYKNFLLPRRYLTEVFFEVIVSNIKRDNRHNSQQNPLTTTDYMMGQVLSFGQPITLPLIGLQSHQPPTRTNSESKRFRTSSPHH
jgi:hypothetical protein